MTRSAHRLTRDSSALLASSSRRFAPASTTPCAKPARPSAAPLRRCLPPSIAPRVTRALDARGSASLRACDASTCDAAPALRFPPATATSAPPPLARRGSRSRPATGSAPATRGVRRGGARAKSAARAAATTAPTAARATRFAAALAATMRCASARTCAFPPRSRSQLGGSPFSQLSSTETPPVGNRRASSTWSTLHLACASASSPRATRFARRAFASRRSCFPRSRSPRRHPQRTHALVAHRRSSRVPTTRPTGTAPLISGANARQSDSARMRLPYPPNTNTLCPTASVTSSESLGSAAARVGPSQTHRRRPASFHISTLQSAGASLPAIGTASATRCSAAAPPRSRSSAANRSPAVHASPWATKRTTADASRRTVRASRSAAVRAGPRIRSSSRNPTKHLVSTRSPSPCSAIVRSDARSARPATNCTRSPAVVTAVAAFRAASDRVFRASSQPCTNPPVTRRIATSSSPSAAPKSNRPDCAASLASLSATDNGCSGMSTFCRGRISCRTSSSTSTHSSRGSRSSTAGQKN